VSQTVVIVLIVVAALLAVAGVAVGSFFLWRRTVRRYVVVLISKRERVSAALAIVAQLVPALARATDGDLVAFALDTTSDERKTLEELAERMGFLTEELATMPLPKHLWDAANELSDAAGLLGAQTGALGGKEGTEALDALAGIDLAKVIGHMDTANTQLGDMAERYGVDDTAVYGGGLYI
jgi:hypothetical protein